MLKKPPKAIRTFMGVPMGPPAKQVVPPAKKPKPYTNLNQGSPAEEYRRRMAEARKADQERRRKGVKILKNASGTYR